MKMLAGKQFENFYWMEGTLEGDQGGRITVLHQGQVMQCSHCLRRADSCLGGGKGRLCRERKTARGEIGDYMRHLKLHHNYTSLKMKFKEEFPQLAAGVAHQDGFGHMKESIEEDHEKNNDDKNESGSQEETILNLQKQLSEANLARESQIHEIAKLKSSISRQEDSMAVLLNKTKEGQINIRADNFDYDEDSDTLKVVDEGALSIELEQHCTASGQDRDKKLSQMRQRILSQVKSIEREKRGRRSSISSVRSVYSGVGTVRRRSETDEEDEKSAKNPKLQSKSLLPAPIQK